MTIDEFASITKRIIKQDGFDGFLPTLCLPARSHVVVLEGVPGDRQKDMHLIVLRWAEEKAGKDEEFLVAFREDAAHFRVMRRYCGHDEERTFEVGVEPPSA